MGVRSRMRLLFIDIHGRYINPTNSQIPAMLKLHHDVVLYGPGLSSELEIERGLERFVEASGHFDFIVSTEAQIADDDRALSWHNRYSYPHHRPEILRRFAVDANEFLGSTSHPRIIFLTKLDVYALSQFIVERLSSPTAYYVAWGDEFAKPFEDLANPEKEKDYARKVERKFKFNAWLEFLAVHRARFINMGHIIGLHEFNWRPLDGRRDRAVVPGVPYFRRAEVQKVLCQAGFGGRRSAVPRLMALADYCGLRPYARPLLHQLYNAQFSNGIGNARYAYTDGSGFDALVRKYFEIPALGTILLCAPCAGFTNVGFVDGHNAILAECNHITDVIAELEARPEWAQQIANAGRQLIWEKHSIQARAKQFSECLYAIQSGNFGGSVWRDGSFQILDRAPQFAK